MGWTGVYMNYTDDKKNKKELVKKYCFRESEREKIIHIENNGNEVYVIVEDNGTKYCLVYLTKIEGYDFWYKDMEVSCNPYYYDCSKKYRDTVAENYVGFRAENSYVKEWLDSWDKNNKAKKEKKDKIKSLKVGTVVEFERGYGADNLKRFVVTSIDGGKVTFNWYKLVNWKQNNFTIIDNAV